MRYFLSDIAKIVGGRLVGCDLEVTSVATDSRSYAITGDALFVAMRGVNHDAHDYIAEVAERGVKAFMVEHEPSFSMPKELYGVVIVKNSLVALQALAEHHRQAFNGKVVAITGSNGKTTVKEWISQCAPSSAPSCCAFTHRVAFEEVSGHRVLIKSGPENRGRSARGTSHMASLEFPPETGLILRCTRKAGNPFQRKQGNRLSCRDQVQDLLRNDGVRTRNEQLRIVDKETKKVVLILTTESQKGIAVNRSM